MDKQHIKGAADKAKGAVKEAVGKSGKVDKAKGAARTAVGDVKDAIKKKK